MLINWFTVIAQAVNFLILVFLLKIFLYDRIIKAMDKRQERIDERLRDAASTKAEAEETRRKLEQDRSDLNGQREDFLRQAKEEAEKRRQELLEQARKEVEQSKSEWMKTMRQEQADLLRELSMSLGREVFSLAGKAVRDLAGSDLHEKMLESFLEYLEKIPDDAKTDLAKAARASGAVVRVITGSDIPRALRQKTTRKIQKILGSDDEIHYETSDFLGVVLDVHGRKVSWNLESYLSPLIERTEEILDANLSGQPAEEKVDGNG